MPIEQQMSELWTVIEGGAEVSQAEIVPFPSDVTGSTLEGVTETVELGNGVATEVSQLTTVEAGATTATTAGVGLLAMDVGAVGLAIAPALGILAGVGLYNLAPSFWDSVANALIEAGETVGGKVRAFLNSDTKEVGFSESTIEIFKQAFMDAGLFEVETTAEETIENPIKYYENDSTSYTNISVAGYNNLPKQTYSKIARTYSNSNDLWYLSRIHVVNNTTHNEFDVLPNVFYCTGYRSNPSGDLFIDFCFDAGKFDITNSNNLSVSAYASANGEENFWGTFSIVKSSINNEKNKYLGLFSLNFGTRALNILNGYYNAIDEVVKLYDSWAYQHIITKAYAVTGETYSPIIQPNATLPTNDPFPQTYPTWTPWDLPSELPSIYPIELPVINPEAEQGTAQAPEALPDNNPDLLSWLLDNFPMPSPNPEPEPTPEPDPDPQPEPDPIEEPEDPTTDPDPVNPNPEPSPSPLPVVPEMPDTVPANAMFTVYKPTITEVNSFGGWLWTASIIEQIKRIWNDPLQGIISFMKVYADAPTTGTDTIKVGVLDSGVSSAVVSGQFVTVDCGTINVSEKFFNATDYSPFVALHLYLPFIGIVELDIDEFMSGSISVVYHVDVYTGTCLAEVKATRTPDMPNATIVYTFSGNASQQLPLTSAEFSGAISALVGVVGGGLAIASGGGLGLLAGATGIAHAVTHEMVHVAHSGSLSANAGIMGARKPFLILTRRRGYDANGYNQIYGYPSNKTVFLNNCTGYVKVKDINLSTGATSQENGEIKELLLNGVIM